MTFSPYLAIGALLASLAAFVAGTIQGHGAERRVWELKLAEQQRDAAALLARSEAAAREQEQRLAAIKDEVEREYLDAESRIAAAHDANAALLAELGGLRDARAVCRADGLPADSRSAAAPSGGPAGGCVLSGQTSKALLDLVALADRTAAYAGACYAWIEGLKTSKIPVFSEPGSKR